MKNKKTLYILYLILLHSICILFSISKLVFVKWGEWLVSTHFLASSFSVYIAMIIVIFPFLSVFPYYFQNNFPNVSTRKKLVLAALLIGNYLLILVYTSIIHLTCL
ncbi:hypothetical protein C7439_12017 [Lachnoanaerobaculum umeaense]|nr:hypothetical protein C7439_12017 [Lachnoanaerobaculum umeaense]